MNKAPQNVPGGSPPVPMGATILALMKFCEIQDGGTKPSWEEETVGAL